MNEEVINELKEEIFYLVNSGFYENSEILEIIEDQFLDENISQEFIAKNISDKYDEKVAKEKSWKNPTDFDILKSCFNKLNENKIVAIHNAGYTLDEGIEDSIEVFHHLQNNKIATSGFCFYHFQDIERAIDSDLLVLAFGDFENSPEKSLEIGKIIVDVLINNGFSVSWNKDVNERIEIKPFIWEKSYDTEEYEMQGAFNSYLESQNIE